MYKIKIIAIGKTKEVWLETALSEYYKRLKPSAEIEFILAKDDLHLLSLAEKESLVIALDAAGTLMTSEAFSAYLMAKLELGGTRLAFIIGGAEGLPQTMKEKYPLVSLSPLTFTHQIVRLVLVEQIYRALEIARNSPYHK